MADIEDALRELYAVAPTEFTALRTELAAAAKKRGDAAGAKTIGAARKPTMSASVVNRLVHSDPGVTDRIADVGERLRAAHAAMDGDQIRELSAEQRRLVGELTRAAIRTAGVANPSAALRDDVTDTLNAAIADPDVAARLGQLDKAEKWSGFGAFGDSTAVLSARGKPAAKAKSGTKPAPKAATKSASQTEDKAATDARAERERRDRARAVVTAAEKAKAEADEVTSQRQSDLATARLRRDDARDRLAKAEAALAAAEAAFEDAKKAGREAADVVKAARRGEG